MARDICIALGERIRQLRLERSWRQIDLAEVCLRMLQTIAKAFEMTSADLLKDLE